MAVEFGTGKTVLILATVVGCFAVLWPKLFYPMLQASLSQKPSFDSSQVCCDVIFETDVNAIKIVVEMCGNILHQYDNVDPRLTKAFEEGRLSKEVVQTCRNEVLSKCGVDITAFLEDRVRLGHTYKQILDEIRSFNSSICLKQNFGVAPGLLGAPRHMRVRVSKLPSHFRQERPPHIRPDMLHPALRERGRAIPQSHIVPLPRVPDKEGKPVPIAGMRPPMGGAGHVVSPPKGTGTMGIIMPIYTVGIVIFFMYTIMKVMFKKPSSGPGGYAEYNPDPEFRKLVFEDEDPVCTKTRPWKGSDEGTKLVATAISGLLAEVDQRRELLAKRVQLEEQAEKTPPEQDVSEDAGEDAGEDTTAQAAVLEDAGDEEDDEEQVVECDSHLAKDARAHDAVDGSAQVQVVNMELTASCEGGQRWSRPTTPVPYLAPPTPPPAPAAPAHVPDPPSIFLEGALPSQSQLLVADSATQAVLSDDEDVPVILSGKVTLSLIGLDHELAGDHVDAEELPLWSATPLVQQEDSAGHDQITAGAVRTSEDEVSSALLAPGEQVEQPQRDERHVEEEARGEEIADKWLPSTAEEMKDRLTREDELQDELTLEDKNFKEELPLRYEMKGNIVLKEDMKEGSALNDAVKEESELAFGDEVKKELALAEEIKEELLKDEVKPELALQDDVKEELALEEEVNEELALADAVKEEFALKDKVKEELAFEDDEVDEDLAFEDEEMKDDMVFEDEEVKPELLLTGEVKEELALEDEVKEELELASRVKEDLAFEDEEVKGDLAFEDEVKAELLLADEMKGELALEDEIKEELELASRVKEDLAFEDEEVKGDLAFEDEVKADLLLADEMKAELALEDEVKEELELASRVKEDLAFEDEEVEEDVPFEDEEVKAELVLADEVHKEVIKELAIEEEENELGNEAGGNIEVVSAKDEVVDPTAVAVDSQVTMASEEEDSLQTAKETVSEPVEEEEDDDDDGDEVENDDEGIEEVTSPRLSNAVNCTDEAVTTTNYTTASAAAEATNATGPEETAADLSALESIEPDDNSELCDEEEVWNGDVDSEEEEDEDSDEGLNGGHVAASTQPQHRQHAR